jgi:putative transposase
MTKIYHPLLALIASATESELAKYVEYLKAENRVLRARLPQQVHTRPEARLRLLKLGKAIEGAMRHSSIDLTISVYSRVTAGG